MSQTEKAAANAIDDFRQVAQRMRDLRVQLLAEREARKTAK